MKLPKILVIGATGKTGRAVVEQLREKDWPVRAVVRTQDARSERLRLLGAETAIADIFDYDQLSHVMRGVSRAYYCPPSHPFMIQSAAAFALAARKSGMETIVSLSQWLSGPEHPSLLTRQTWLADRMFSDIGGATHTIINPGYFADNYLRLIDFAALLGIFPVLTGRSLNAPPSNEDIARVAVAALTDPARHAGRAYRPTGPKLISAYDMAAVMEKVLGSRVRAINMPMWMFTRAARMQGVTAFELSGLRHYIEDHKRGAFERGAPTNDVYEVTGRKPEDFETVVRRYAALPFAQRTPANRLWAFLNFSLVPVNPGYNLDRYDREHFHPVPPVPRLAMDSENWKAGHGAFDLPRRVNSPVVS